MAKGNSSARGGRPYRGGRGRGRGQGGGRGTGRGRGGQPGSSLLQENFDFIVQMYTDAAPIVPPPPGPFAGGRGGQTPQRGRGRGDPGPSRGQFSNLNVGTSSPNRGRGWGRSRGREFDFRGGRRRYSEGIGASPRDRGGPMRPKTTLSELLLQERPLLRPVKFVPSVHTRVLFQDEEDLLQPLVEEVDDTEQSHVPTADRVLRVFSGRNTLGLEDDLDEEVEVVDFNDVGKLFDSTIRTSESTAATRKSTLSVSMMNEENQSSGAHVNCESQKPSTNCEDLAQIAHATLSVTERSHNILMGISASTEVTQTLAFRSDDDDDIIVYVAPHPRNALSRPKDVLEKATDQIPASSLTLLVPDPPPLSSAVFSVAKSPITVDHTAAVFNRTSTTATTPRLHIPPITTTRQAKLWKQKLGRANKRKQRVALSSKPSFGAFGAIREEALLNKFEEKPDKRYDERRRGDSDLEWGDTDDDDVEQEEIDSDMQVVPKLEKGKGKAPADKEEELEDHGMDVDADLYMDALKSFVGGLLGPDAGKHVTMDEIKDEDTMRMEDEMDWHEQRDSSEDDEEGDDDDDETGDEELETAIRGEEAKLMAESEEDKIIDGADDDDDEEEEGSEDGQFTRRSFQPRLERLRNSALQRKNGDASFEDGDDDEDDDDDEGLDDGQFAQRSFQARLERLRSKALQKNGDAFFEDNHEEDSDDLFKQNLAWAEEEDDLINQIHDMLDQNEVILERKGKKQRKGLFRDLPGSDVNGLEGIITPRKRKKDRYKDLPLELRVQWEKDRLKKADYKNAREAERLARAADPLSQKKGGKKGRKAMLVAASSDPTIIVLPNRVIDLTTLVQQIRRFIADIGGPSSMALPPTNKATRKDIHDIALAFGLKSQSKGKERVRYTTLYKTSLSGQRVDEAKVARIMRRSGGPGSKRESFSSEGWKRKNAGTMPKQREGDEVGKAAPKIDETNVGFRLLTMMGWSEGNRVGASMKGLAAPLPAIIKTSKLGLGAMKSRKTVE